MPLRVWLSKYMCMRVCIKFSGVSIYCTIPVSIKRLPASLKDVSQLCTASCRCYCKNGINYCANTLSVVLHLSAELQQLKSSAFSFSTSLFLTLFTRAPKCKTTNVLEKRKCGPLSRHLNILHWNSYMPDVVVSQDLQGYVYRCLVT